MSSTGDPNPPTTVASDRIEIRGLRFTAVVGVLPEERTRAQPVEVDLDLEADLAAAGESDDLGRTVDYGAVCDLVADTIAAHQPELLERLAELIAQAVLAADGAIASVTVALRKLRPPVAHHLASAGVRITRRRS